MDCGVWYHCALIVFIIHALYHGRYYRNKQTGLLNWCTILFITFYLETWQHIKITLLHHWSNTPILPEIKMYTYMRTGWVLAWWFNGNIDITTEWLKSQGSAPLEIRTLNWWISDLKNKESRILKTCIIFQAVTHVRTEHWIDAISVPTWNIVQSKSRSNFQLTQCRTWKGTIYAKKEKLSEVVGLLFYVIADEAYFATKCYTGER